MTSARREPDNSPLLLHGILMEAREGTDLSCKRKKEAADKTHKLQGRGEKKKNKRDTEMRKKQNKKEIGTRVLLECIGN